MRKCGILTTGTSPTIKTELVYYSRTIESVPFSSKKIVDWQNTGTIDRFLRGVIFYFLHLAQQHSQLPPIPGSGELDHDFRRRRVVPFKRECYCYCGIDALILPFHDRENFPPFLRILPDLTAESSRLKSGGAFSRTAPCCSDIMVSEYTHLNAAYDIFAQRPKASNNKNSNSSNASISSPVQEAYDHCSNCYAISATKIGPRSKDCRDT
ncbi:hypothetical protein Trydic_g413 [Trypoxylus dichotomus]